MHHYWNDAGDVRCSAHLQRDAGGHLPGTYVRMSRGDVTLHRGDMAAADLEHLPICDECRRDELAWMVVA